MFKKKIWIACGVITLIYWATWHSYQDDPYKNFTVNPVLRHALNFFLLLLVALVGFYGWSSYHQSWLKKLWALTYASFLLLTIILGFADLIWVFKSVNFRYMISGLRLFFTSPVPYGILMFLAKKNILQKQ